MTQKKIVLLTICYLCLSVLVHPMSTARAASLYQTVKQALKHSPQLKALVHNQAAIEHDHDQTRRLRRPTIDLNVGQGLEQHSDDKTRETGADPSDSDWDSKADASIKLIQKLYDGGETRSLISIQKSLLDASHYRIQAATQAIALEAIDAHLDVYMQHKLVELAQKNLKVHQDIHELLSEREQAGAGDIADVTQTSARMARAQSNLFVKKADLSRALANYARVVGTVPENLAYANVPEGIPDSVEEALRWTEAKNPELLAFNASLAEVDAKVALARSPYKPRINFELSSSYNDQVEGSDTWENTNEAMVVLRWNLYNGGRDRVGIRAAQSRKYERRANRKDLLLTLRETTTAAWENYLSLQRQIGAYRDAAKYSRNTFEAYMNQYNISRRSLLDVLNAESDYHQAASQLLVATMEKTLEAYRLLNLAGAIELTNLSLSTADSDELGRLSRSMVFPLTDHVVSPDIGATSEVPDRDQPSHYLSIRIGPCLNKMELEQAEKYLQARQLQTRRKAGNGKVKFYRLLEGVYPPAEARKRMKALKDLGHSAFVIPEGTNLALFAGSFHRSSRAKRLKGRLEENDINVRITEREIERRGTILLVPRVTRDTADAIEEYMRNRGLSTKVIRSDS